MIKLIIKSLLSMKSYTTIINGKIEILLLVFVNLKNRKKECFNILIIS